MSEDKPTELNRETFGTAFGFELTDEQNARLESIDIDAEPEYQNLGPDWDRVFKPVDVEVIVYAGGKPIFGLTRDGKRVPPNDWDVHVISALSIANGE